MMNTIDGRKLSENEAVGGQRLSVHGNNANMYHVQSQPSRTVSSCLLYVMNCSFIRQYYYVFIFGLMCSFFPFLIYFTSTNLRTFVLVAILTTILHWNICQHYVIKMRMTPYKHHPETITENKEEKELWNI